MSKSVRAQSGCNCTGFIAKANSKEGSDWQNARLSATWVLRLCLVSLFSLLISAVSHAQPAIPGDWKELVDILGRPEINSNPYTWWVIFQGIDTDENEIWHGGSWWSQPVDGSTIDLVSMVSGFGAEWGIRGNLRNLEGPFGWVDNFWLSHSIDNLETLIVQGHLYNESRIWSVQNIYAASIDNNNGQIRGYSLPTAFDPDNTTNRGSNIFTAGSLRSQGVNALVDGWSEPDETGHGSMMDIGGNLENISGALIRGYGYIIVHGDFLNQGATLVGGNWYWHEHEPGDGMPSNPGQTFQSGLIDIWGNVRNITQHGTAHDVVFGSNNDIFGGLIASFDLLQVHGSLFNDANSMITGDYAYSEFFSGADVEIFGRRANVLGGVLVDGSTSHDKASVLTVRGIFPDTVSLPGLQSFNGLYNEGNIQAIDIINVGSDENGVLWNVRASTAWGATLPSTPGYIWDPVPGGPIGSSGTITDIGIINATNLINSGTISDIDSAINVSYVLVNELGGTLDGRSTSHVQWTYAPDGTPLFREEVQEITRATLHAGQATAVNQFVPMEILSARPSLSPEGIGIVNYGAIRNFATVSSQGDVYNYGVFSDVASISVGFNASLAERADFHSAGTLQNVGNVYVSGNLFLEMGSSFGNVGTLVAQNDVQVNGTVNGGFRVLSAETGTLTVGSAPQGILPGLTPGLVTTGSLAIDRGATAAAFAGIENYGIITNNGVVNSAAGIENWGTFTNNGVVSANDIFRNQGRFSGTGVVSFSAPNGFFENASSGVITGGHVINGNFWNNNGAIAALPDSVIRVVNGKAFINGGTVNGSAYLNPEVGKQYLFLATDRPGDLQFVTDSGELKGFGNGVTGSVLDFTPVYGSWDGTRYVPGRQWSRNNQFYWLEVKRAYSYGAHAETPNQIAVGNYIDTIGMAPKRGGGLWNLLQQLDGISDDPSNPYYHPNYRQHQGLINPAALRALDEMSGMIYANLGAASVHNTGVVNRTLADVLRSDVFKFSYIGNPNNAIRGQAIAPLRYTRWGTLFGIGGTTQHDGNADGYKTSFGGVLAGVDRAMWTGTRIGAYLSAAVGDVSMRNLDESSDTTSVSVGMYLRQEMYYGYGLATAGFGVDNYKTERNLTMINHRAEGKTHAKIGSVYLERGIDLPVYYATLQPYTSFQVVSIHQDKFTERMWNHLGQYSDVGLEGVKGRTDSFKLALGTRAASQPIPLPWGQLALTGNMAWFHEFNGKGDRDFIARFANPSGSNFGTQYSDLTFRIDGNDPKQDWFNLGLGLNMDRNSTRVFLGADLYTNDRQTLFSGNLGFNTSW